MVVVDSKLISRKGGRPRKDGTPALTRIVGTNGKKIRVPRSAAVAATASGLDVSAILTGDAPNKPSTASGEPGSGLGSVGAREALKTDIEPGSSSPVPAVPQIEYGEVVAVANMIIAAKNPRWTMLPKEQQAIGAALDALIAKYFPDMKNAGVEVALILAVGAYVSRVIFTTEPERPVVDRIDAAPPVPPQSIGDPFAGTGTGG